MWCIYITHHGFFYITRNITHANQQKLNKEDDKDDSLRMVNSEEKFTYLQNTIFPIETVDSFVEDIRELSLGSQVFYHYFTL